MSDLVETDIGYIPKKDLNKWNLVIHYMTPILEFYKDPLVTEIMVNRYDSIFIENRKGMVKTEACFDSEEHLQKFVRQFSIVLNQDSEKMDVLDARFPDQSRACCTMPSVTPGGATATIRCAPKTTLSFSDLVGFNSLSQDMADFIKNRVLAEDNIIISGSTGSGKTTLLRAIAEYIPDSDRVLCCEDTQELFLNLPNQIPMEAPKRAVGNINLSFLIKTTLRQRPDRVFVGEIRDAFACDAFLQVINTGHGGCATSIHANNPEAAIRRIQYLLTKEGLIGYELAGQEVRGSVNLLIQADKTRNGKRVTDISIVNNDGKIIQVYGYKELDDSHVKVNDL